MMDACFAELGRTAAGFRDDRGGRDEVRPRPRTATVESPDLLARRWPLDPAQRRFEKVIGPLWSACDRAARLLGRPRVSPRENTRRCFESFFDPLCADTGIWPDYTGGYFERGDETYEEAKLAQLDLILDHTGAGEGTRLLDLGCGNGKLLERARARGCVVQGVTRSRAQAEACRAAGLDVLEASFDELTARLPAGAFDVVVLDGPAEHFVNEDDVLTGREEAVRRELFAVLNHLVRPGGRVFLTSIHFRWPTAIEETVEHPLRHPIGSYYFNTSVLVGMFSGWYPSPGTYERLAGESGFDLVYEEDTTRHYLQTSRLWIRRLRDFVRHNPGFVTRFFGRLWLEDPRYFFFVALFWMYDPWTWQFRGGDQSPMVHRWLGFVRRPAASGRHGVS